MPHRVRQAADWFATPHVLDVDRSSTSMNRDLIESFAAGGDILRRAVHGLSRDDLLARPGPGDWSIQELVIHLADSDEIAIDRMKRILTEDNPALLYADESAYIADFRGHPTCLFRTHFSTTNRRFSPVFWASKVRDLRAN
jgi:hypothetical protein